MTIRIEDLAEGINTTANMHTLRILNGNDETQSARGVATRSGHQWQSVEPAVSSARLVARTPTIVLSL